MGFGAAPSSRSSDVGIVGWHEGIVGMLSAALLFLCMAYPAVSRLVVVKASLFGGLLALIVLGYFMSGRFALDRRIALWTIGLAVISFLFILEGMFNGAPGAEAVISVYVLWPLAFTLWISGLASSRLVGVIDRTAIVATLFIGAYGILYLLTEVGVSPTSSLMTALSFGWSGQSFGAETGYTQMAIAGLNTLPFLLPYVMACVALEGHPGSGTRTKKMCMWAACICGWSVMMIAGRRALILVTALAPLMILCFRQFQPPEERNENRRPVMVLCAVLLCGIVILFAGLESVYRFNVSDLWHRFVVGFDLGAQTGDESAIARHQQIVVLVREWLAHPIFGAGHGASALGSIRSETMPWAYELTYLALLFQTGIVGFSCYCAGVLWIIREGVRVIELGGRTGRIMLSMLVGLCSLLIANGTNPYLLKFDGMWMLFMPLAVLNYAAAMRYKAKRCYIS